MKEHHETIQFINNIEEVENTSLHKTIHEDKISQPRYQTIDIREHLKKERENKRYDDGRIENKILRRVKN